jgi:hypothetical protein
VIKLDGRIAMFNSLKGISLFDFNSREFGLISRPTLEMVHRSGRGVEEPRRDPD